MLNRVKYLAKSNMNDIVLYRTTEKIRFKTLDILESVSQQVPLYNILIQQVWENLINKIWIEI